MALACLSALVIVGTPGEPALAGPRIWTTHGPYGGSVYVVAPDPTTVSRVYAAGLGGIFVSATGGASWTLPIGGAGMTFVDDIVPDPAQAGTAYEASEFHVAKTTDGGTTWLPASSGIPTGSTIFSLAVAPTTTSTLYAGALGIYKTTNGGQTWIRAIDTPLFLLYTVAVDPAHPATIYAAGGSDAGDGPRILRSTNGGHTWATAP